MTLEHLNKKILIDQDSVDELTLDNYVAIGGLIDLIGMRTIADSYKNRADDLVEIAVNNRDIAYEYTYPILFLYRHSLELYLKIISTDFKRTHKFDNLIHNLREKAKDRLSDDILRELISRIIEFKEIDNRSTRFRYGNQIGGEYIINLGQLQLTFNEISMILKRLADVHNN